MSVSSTNQEPSITGSVNVVFSLQKLSFIACSRADRRWCRRNCPMLVTNMRQCCIDLIRFLKTRSHHEKYRNYNRIVIIAARLGHVGCLALAHENGLSTLNFEVCTLAAQYGNLNCLKYAYENGYMMSEEVCIEAALNGNLDCLVYAHKNGALLSKRTSLEAAREGHLQCMIYAHKNGCPLFDDNFCVCHFAVGRGYFEILKYAHENGCRWDERVFATAMLSQNNAEIINYLFENGCPYNKNFQFT